MLMNHESRRRTSPIRRCQLAKSVSGVVRVTAHHIGQGVKDLGPPTASVMTMTVGMLVASMLSGILVVVVITKRRPFTRWCAGTASSRCSTWPMLSMTN